MAHPLASVRRRRAVRGDGGRVRCTETYAAVNESRRRRDSAWRCACVDYPGRGLSGRAHAGTTKRGAADAVAPFCVSGRIAPVTDLQLELEGHAHSAAPEADAADGEVDAVSFVAVERIEVADVSA